MNLEEQTISEILALDDHETKLRLVKLHEKQTAILFAEWVADSVWVKYPPVEGDGFEDIWYKESGEINEQSDQITTEQLYEKFIKSLEA